MAEKVVLGLSGGMDSAYAALTLINSGYEVIGVNIVMKDTCDCSEKAKHLAKQLGIEYYTIDAKQLFINEVILPFAKSYTIGMTPNPCALCNPKVKFKQLFAFAEKIGLKYIATGHYAIPKEISGRYSFAPAKDHNKDQCYFLYGLSQEMISRLLFPLGNVMKSDIKEFFKTNNCYSSVSNTESTDICFVNNGKYADIVSEYMPLPSPGNLIDENGVVLGKHKGIHNYTIGQRKGLGVSLGVPAYVSNINAIDNTVTLSSGTSYCMNSFNVSKINFLSEDSVEVGAIYKVRTRYRAKPLQCIVDKVTNEYASFSFTSETSIAAPGQIAVFYDINDCIAFGGEISR